MKILLLLLSLIFTINSAYSYTNQWYLKAGATAVIGRATTLNESKLNNLAEGNEDKYESNFYGGGFNTHFGKRYVQSEFSVSSYVFISSLDKLYFQAGDTEVTGSGSQRTVAFAPIYKYNFIDYELKKAWVPYFSLGAIWSLQTITLDNYSTVSGNYQQDYKLVISSRGVIVAIGVEEALPYKEMHPVYIEFAYAYLRAYKSGLIDASNYAEVETINESSIAQHVSGHLFMLSMGITVF